MMNDIDILSVLKDREDYERFYPLIKDNFLTREGETIGEYVGSMFHENPAGKTIDWSVMAAWFFIKHPMMKPDQKDIYKVVFKSLTKYKPGDDAFRESVVKELTTKHYAGKISDLSMSIMNKTSPLEINDLLTTIDEYNNQMGTLSSTIIDPHIITADPTQLYGLKAARPVLKFSLKGLRKACGGVEKGDFVLVASYSGAGKSTFLISQTVHMFNQLPEDKYILYFNNEQRGETMKKRIISGLTLKTQAQITTDPVTACKNYESLGGERIILYDHEYMTAKVCEDIIRKYKDKIGLILFDQLWKVQGISKKNASDYMKLANQFLWARSIAKQHAPVIAAHQADGTTYGTKYINQSQLFGSKVAVQGEMDAIITIGQTEPGLMKTDLRHFFVPKNKLNGEDPAALNLRFDARLNHNYERYEDIA